MKKERKIVMAMTIIGLLLGLVTTVSAKAWGDTMQFFGVNLGWMFIGIAGLALLGGGLFLDKKIFVKFKPLMAIGIIGLIGAVLIGAQVEEVAVITEESVVKDWEITGSAMTTGWSAWPNGNANCSVVNNDDKGGTCSVPIRVDNAGDTVNETEFSFNFTIDPTARTGALTTRACSMYFKTDYDMSYSGEPLLAKSGNYYIANVSDSDAPSTWKWYDGSIDMTVDETGWACFRWQIDSGADTVGEEFDVVGETTSFKITFWDDYGYTETYTVTIVVVDLGV